MRTENNTVTNTYDKLGRVTKTEDAEGNTKQYEYNSLNFVTRQTDEGGDITDYGCSVWGEQTYRREHNSGGSGEQVWNITYNAYGEATKEEKNDGSIWTYEYDERFF